VGRHGGERATGEPVDEFRCLRALHRDQRGLVGDVDDVAGGRRVLAEPLEVLRDVAGVENDHEVIVGALVEDAVVDDPTARPAQQRVDRLARRRRFARVRGQLRHDLARACAAQVGLAHVRDVEQADGFAHGLVLLDRPGRVRHGHVPAREIHELRAELPVRVPQRGLLQLHRARHYTRGLDRREPPGSENPGAWFSEDHATSTCSRLTAGSRTRPPSSK
jgi:hypothetical protein